MQILSMRPSPQKEKRKDLYPPPHLLLLQEASRVILPHPNVYRPEATSGKQGYCGEFFLNPRLLCWRAACQKWVASGFRKNRRRAHSICSLLFICSLPIDVVIIIVFVSVYFCVSLSRRLSLFVPTPLPSCLYVYLYFCLLLCVCGAFREVYSGRDALDMRARPGARGRRWYFRIFSETKGFFLFVSFFFLSDLRWNEGKRGFALSLCGRRVVTDCLLDCLLLL